MFKKIIPFVLTVYSLTATITRPWEICLENGYQQDHIKWRLDEEIAFLPYKENYKDLKSLCSRLEIQKVYRDIYFEMSGSYSVFAKGKMNQELNLDYFCFDTDGHSYSLSSSLGILANLTPDRHYQVILLPFFKYSFFASGLSRKNSNPEFIDNTSSAGDTIVFSSLSKQLKNSWFGPSIGIQLWVKPYDCIEFQVSYSFHWLCLRSDFEMSAKTQEEGLESLQTQRGKVNNSGNLGHFGSIKTLYNPQNCWQTSIAGYLYYVSSHVHSVNVTQVEQEFFPASSVIETISKRKYKLRSASVQILLGITRFF